MLSLTYSLKLVLSSFADCKEQDIIFYVMLCDSFGKMLQASSRIELAITFLEGRKCNGCIM